MTALRDQAAELAARYADCVNRYDESGWATCWAPDAVWQVGPNTSARGRDDIVAMWRTAMARHRTVVQILGQGVTSADDGHLRGRWHFQEYAWRRDGTNGLLLGYYQDEYVDTPNGLRFSHRILHRYYHGSADCNHEPADTIAEGALPWHHS